jgi:hypothetical protein
MENKLEQYLPEIKIKKTSYQVNVGDYIQYNGSCWLFCSGDHRYLRTKGFDRFTYVELTKKALSEIDFDKLSYTKTNNGIELEKYHF